MPKPAQRSRNYVAFRAFSGYKADLSRDSSGYKDFIGYRDTLATIAFAVSVDFPAYTHYPAS